MNTLKIKARRDINSKLLSEGDIVFICNIPDLSGMSSDNAKSLLPIFRYALGKKFKVSWFEDLGLAAIDFHIHFGDNRGNHTIFMEPYYLNKVSKLISTN